MFVKNKNESEIEDEWHNSENIKFIYLIKMHSQQNYENTVGLVRFKIEKSILNYFICICIINDIYRNNCTCTM